MMTPKETRYTHVIALLPVKKYDGRGNVHVGITDADGKEIVVCADSTQMAPVTTAQAEVVADEYGIGLD